MIAKETIKKLKETRPNTRLYQAELSYKDPDGNLQSVEFIFRKPKVADMESYSKGAQNSVLTANMNLLTSIIVHPEAKEIKEKLEDAPNVVGNFVNKEIVPFFGDMQAAEVKEI